MKKSNPTFLKPQNMKKFFSGISRNIVLLGFVSLFTDLSSQMVFPLVPLYLTGVLGASSTDLSSIRDLGNDIDLILFTCDKDLNFRHVFYFEKD